MRTRDLTDELLMMLRLLTPAPTKSSTSSTSSPTQHQPSLTSHSNLLRDEYVITDWFKGGTLVPPNEWARFAYDANGLEGIYRDCYQVARVHYADESNAWRWMAHPNTGSRYGISTEETSRDIVPHQSMSRVDTYLEYFALYPDEFRNSIGNEYLTEPYSQPLFHPTRPWRLLSWHYRNGRSKTRGRAPRYDHAYFRLWVLTPSGIRNLPVRHRTNRIVQRAEHPSLMGATIRVKRDSVFWEVSVAPHREQGTSRTPDEAFHQVDRTLSFLGCTSSAKQLHA